MSDEEGFTTPVCDEESEQQLLSEPLIFNGDSGMRPSAEARRYVYRVATIPGGVAADHASVLHRSPLGGEGPRP